jgi:hypothetical protein
MNSIGIAEKFKIVTRSNMKVMKEKGMKYTGKVEEKD